MSNTTPNWTDTTVGRFFTRFRMGMNDGRDIAARYEELSRMSNSALAKRGLTRQDIARAALKGF